LDVKCCLEEEEEMHHASASLLAGTCAGLFALAAAAVAAPAPTNQGEISIARGHYISIVGGCNDCHTPGFAESNGQVPEKVWLTGVPVGHRGPWGTTYAVNLRLKAASMSEDEWVHYLKTLKTRPPMPWFAVNMYPESDTRSLYRFIKSLGDPGKPAPAALPPGQEPKTPYTVDAPPTMPH
jgi:mono/diheme cytochrome c family protein